MEDDYTSAYIVEPDQQQVQEINQERAMVTGAAAMMDTILDWFDQQIAEAETIKGLNIESKVELETQVLAKTKYVEFLTKAKSRLEGLASEHLGT